VIQFPHRFAAPAFAIAEGAVAKSKRRIVRDINVPRLAQAYMEAFPVTNLAPKIQKQEKCPPAA
jgi:hypothetical protein